MIEAYTTIAGSTLLLGMGLTFVALSFMLFKMLMDDDFY